MRTQSTRRRSLWVGLVGLIIAGLVSQGRAQSPTTQPLVQASNLRYLGFFRLPDNDGSGATTGELTYGGTALGLSANGGLFFGGHDWYQRLCEATIPAIGATATIRQRCVDVAEGRRAQIDGGAETKLGGTLVWNGRLIVSSYSYYDADTSATKSHFASGTNLPTTGDVTGPFQVGTAGAGFVAGYMGIIPTEWRSLLGGPALTGQCCLSIISRTSSGPAVAVFNPDDVGRVTPVPAKQVLAYPIDHPLAPGTTQSTLYTRGDQMGGVAFPAGTRSVLFIGKHGTGQYCYGEAAACGDPASVYKGEHAYPYIHQVWAYDANELVAVKNGTKQAWQVRPYATWRLTDINNNGSASIASATFDPSTRRLYITETYGGTPRVHVYEITVGTSQPPTPSAEVCGDGIDNDLDGQIDEGCTVPGPAPGPAPGPGPSPTPEVCGDGVDNDQDGAVDEGCPGAPQRLTGDVQGNSNISLSWLAPINGTVPADYIVEAGVSPGQAAYSFSTGTQTSTRVQNVGTGKYYVRVRAKNAAGRSVPSNEVALSVGCSGSPNPLTNLIIKIRGGLVTTTWTDPDGCTDTSYRLAVTDSAGAVLGVVSTESPAVTALAGPGVYYLRAAAVSNRGVSQPTAPMRLVVNSGACVPPQFNTHLVSSVTGSLVQLAWNPTSIAAALANDAVAPLIYVLEVGTGPGLTNILRTPIGRTTFAATPAPAGTYYVRVRPADLCGLGTSSNEIIVRVP